MGNSNVVLLFTTTLSIAMDRISDPIADRWMTANDIMTMTTNRPIFSSLDDVHPAFDDLRSDIFDVIIATYSLSQFCQHLLTVDSQQCDSDWIRLAARYLLVQ